MRLSHPSRRAPSGQTQAGNVLFMLLIVVVLFAGLTVVITKGNQGSGSLSGEKTNLAADQVSTIAVDIKRAVETILRAGNSETTLRFAHADLTGYGTVDAATKTEVFNIAGGGATMVPVPANINNGSQWEFTGSTAAPGVGDDARPDLLLVLPNVTESFCRAFNKKAGYALTDAIPADTAACVYNTAQRFNGTFPTSGINTMDSGTFRALPAAYACVACGSAYHVYYTLMER